MTYVCSVIGLPVNQRQPMSSELRIKMMSEIVTKGIRIDCSRKFWHYNNGYSNCHGVIAPAHNFVELLEPVSGKD